ncbi:MULTISPECIES: ribosome biogenesis GTP-binding protein YihA/YsxC [Clostridiaceae]|uniref:Probable GTP-binding protein EngB n=1 Tax=Clostridium facile TaxID=2763035 RepID=A0ABR7IQE8_9CLOT|nr:MULTISPECIES: ribosome biogenesis GTP-binding protein YihA/YsxC [Clostridiaceae]MBC5787375.1 YihA family ribosome biogenesis GTP-binding protein [Clostridium facile]PWM98149.1 MAG: YihA family ribosome biogenesis GTP-binding protein [Massilioclostridium sp.]
MKYNQAKFITSYGLLSQIPPSEKIEVAFAGRSNVGKSSLLNRLFSRKNLARVSSVPGKTATINFYQVEDVYFVDLPGYGYAKVAKTEKQRWSELIEGYFHSDRDLALVVQLIDMRHPPTKLDLQMIDFLIESELPFLIVLTKMDKLSKRQQQARLEELRQELPYADQITILPCSAETGEGIEELRELLDDVCTIEDEDI